MNKLQNFARTPNGQLALFLLLATLLAWLVWVPATFVTYGLPGYQLPLFGLLGTMGAGIAALIMAGTFQGRTGLRDLAHRLAPRRAGFGWYIAAALMPLLLLLTAFYGYSALGGQPLAGAPVVLPALMVIILVQAPNTFLEELGWRGYAYPRLMPGRNLVLVSVLFGLFHTAWHLPYWLTSPLVQQYGLPYLLLAAGIVLSMTVIFTWLWVHSRGSVLIAWLFHLALNTSSVVVPLAPDVTGSLVPMAIEVSVMILAAVVVSASMLRRGSRPIHRELRVGV